MVVKSFRGQLEDGGQDHIRLQTIKGKVGYRIVKFQIIGPQPGEGAMLDTVKIYKTKQTTIDNTIKFTDSNLLGMAFILQSSGITAPFDMVVIFDREIFNQDIYITHVDTAASNTCNYYLELEVVPLTDSDAEFTTLKDIRGRNTTP